MNATLFAAAVQALIVVVTASALVSTLVSRYVSGMVLGFGLVGLAWGVLTVYQRLNKCDPRPTGRSLTRDCHQAVRQGPALPFQAPRPPTPAQRRVRPCPGSRQR
ncbi:MAG: hypothetical protein ACRDZ8_14410 [Acidimicrobiales bacterium]